MKLQRNRIMFSGHLEGKLPTEIDEEIKIPVCEHKIYCPIRICKGNCQIKKFYNKYGEMYNYLGT